MTPFEQALEASKNPNVKTPMVSFEGKIIDYFGYQLATHKFNLTLMAKGMTFKGIKFKDLKDYYGLKGRSAKDCLPQLNDIFNEYSKTINKKLKTPN